MILWSRVKTYLGWILFYLFLALILVNNSLGYLDPDFGWHLKVGEQIFIEKNIPHDQVYMWPLANQSWVDHEWLANLLIYNLWQAGGYILITIFFIILALASLIILNYYVFKNYLTRLSHRLAFAFLEILALVGILPHFGVRVQELAFLFSILTFIIIDSCRRRQNIKLAYWLIPLMFIWACLHGSFLFGLAIIIGWLVYELILKFISWFKKLNSDQALTSLQLIKLFIIILLAGLITLLTPYKQELYTFLKDYGQNRYYLSHIEEWRSPYSLNFRYDQILFSVLILVLVFYILIIAKKPLALWKIVLGLLLFILASRSVRHFPLWAGFSLLFFIPPSIKYTLENTKLVNNKLIINLIIICLILISIILSLKINFTNQPFSNYCEFYPYGAVQFLKNNPQYSQLKIFNDYGWGGFLIATWPEKRIFIDGRLPQYKFKNHTILEEYHLFFQKDLIAQKLDEYNIDLILFKNKEPEFKTDWLEQFITGQKSEDRKNPLLEYLKSTTNWQKIFEDQTAVVYVRKK